MLEAIHKIIDNRIPLVIDIAKVVTVNENSCKVQSITTGKVYFKCAYNAIFKNESDFITLKPEIGSNVIIAITDEKNYIIQVSKIKSLTFKYKQMNFHVDDQGLKLENKGENLGALLGDFITDLKAAVITTPSGPGTFAPSTITKLTALDLKFKKVLNSN